MQHAIRFGALCAAAFMTCACATHAAGVDAISKPDWAATSPAAADYRKVYPARALAAGMDGQVYLDCVINPDRTLDCVVAQETPPGMGFGEAAMTLSRAFIVKRESQIEALKIGARVTVPIRFVS